MMRIESKTQSAQLFRPTRGNFDQWHRYRVLSKGRHVGTIASGQLLPVPRDYFPITIHAGMFVSREIHTAKAPDQILICELSANPKNDPEAILVHWISEQDVQQRVMRFDRPPYWGGRAYGLTLAIVAALIFGLGGQAFLIAGIAEMIAAAHHSDYSSVIVTLGLTVASWLFCTFISVTGIRSLYYYFKLPRSWQH